MQPEWLKLTDVKDYVKSCYPRVKENLVPLLTKHHTPLGLRFRRTEIDKVMMMYAEDKPQFQTSSEILQEILGR